MSETLYSSGEVPSEIKRFDKNLFSPVFNLSDALPPKEILPIRQSLDNLRMSIPPNDQVAERIAQGAYSLGGIHGLKAILKHMNLYSGPLDAKVKYKDPKGRGPDVNPVAKALIDFQYRYNTPHNLGEDGRPLGDLRPGIPASEYGRLGESTKGILLAYAQRNNITLPPAPTDTKFETEGAFLMTYKPLISLLTNTFGLPENYLFAIAKVESNLGTNPTDNRGGNGVMQLTSAPLRDMSGDTAIRGRIDTRKIQIYQKLFQRLDLNALKSLPFSQGEKKTLSDSLHNDIWNTLVVLCSKNTQPSEFRDAMLKVRSWERGIYRGLTYHTLNIIISTVYQGYIQEYRIGSNPGISNFDRAFRLAEKYNGGGHPGYAENVANKIGKIPKIPYNTFAAKKSDNKA